MCHPDYTTRSLTHDRLAIQAAFTRDDQISIFEGFFNAIQGKHIRGSGQQFTIEQVHHLCRYATSGARAGVVGDLAAHDLSDMGHATFQLLYLLRRGTFLRGIKPC